jgi:hypothetical protein
MSRGSACQTAETPGPLQATTGCCEAGQWCCSGAEIIPHCGAVNQFCCGPLSCDRDPENPTLCIPPPD